MYYPFADRLEGRGHHSPATSIKSPSFQKKQRATLLSQRQITVSHSKVRSSKRCRKTKIYVCVCMCVSCVCSGDSFLNNCNFVIPPTLIIHTPITLRCMDPIHLYNAQLSISTMTRQEVLQTKHRLSFQCLKLWSQYMFRSTKLRLIDEANMHRPLFVTYLSGFEIQATESWTFCIHKSWLTTWNNPAWRSSSQQLTTWRFCDFLTICGDSQCGTLTLAVTPGWCYRNMRSSQKSSYTSLAIDMPFFRIRNPCHVSW